MTRTAVRALRRCVPLALLAVGLVWAAGIGFRLGWWHTGNLDLAWDGAVGAVSGPWGRSVAAVLDVVGTGLPAVACAIVVSAAVAVRRNLRLGIVALATCSVSALDVRLLKAVAGRPRPDGAFGLHDAFPSGHTAFAAVLACLVAVLLLEGRARAVPLLYPVIMGWSRTALHAHWLTDVVAGCALGAATVLLCLAAVPPSTSGEGEPGERGGMQPLRRRAARP